MELYLSLPSFPTFLTPLIPAPHFFSIAYIILQHTKYFTYLFLIFKG